MYKEMASGITLSIHLLLSSVKIQHCPTEQTSIHTQFSFQVTKTYKKHTRFKAKTSTSCTCCRTKDTWLPVGVIFILAANIVVGIEMGRQVISDDYHEPRACIERS